MPQVWQSGKGAEWPPGGTEPCLGDTRRDHLPGTCCTLGRAAGWGPGVTSRAHGEHPRKLHDKYSSLWWTREQSATLGPCPRPWAGPVALRTAGTPAEYTRDNADARAQASGGVRLPVCLFLRGCSKDPRAHLHCKDRGWARGPGCTPSLGSRMNLDSHLQVVLASPAAPASAPPPRARVWAEPSAVQCLQCCRWPHGGSRVQRVQGLEVHLPGQSQRTSPGSPEPSPRPPGPQPQAPPARP